MEQGGWVGSEGITALINEGRLFLHQNYFSPAFEFK